MSSADGLTKEQMLWLDLVKKKPVKFGIEAGFDDLRELHNEWIKTFLFSKRDETLQAHRGSYKTTSLSIAMALLIVTHPEKTILFMRKTDDDVKEIVSQTANLLLTDLFQELAYVLYDKALYLTKQSVFEIGTNLDETASGTPQLLGIGAGASLTGKHADLIITDDIINMKDRYSKAERDRTKNVYQELENIKNKGGRFINTGTPWHKDDAFKLMPNIRKFDAYTTGLMTHEEIQDKRTKMSVSLFSANYELKHISDEEAMFTSPTIDVKANVHKIYDGICHIDASYGGDDNTAFTILKEGDDGMLYVYGDLSEKHVDDVLDKFELKREQYRAGTLYNESNADKGYLAKKVIPPVKVYNERMNKYIKISTFLRENWHRIIFVYDTSNEYINQILDYNENAERDDAPDSLSSIIRIYELQKSQRSSGNVATALRGMGL